jgi:hypothetical protein
MMPLEQSSKPAERKSALPDFPFQRFEEIAQEIRKKHLKASSQVKSSTARTRKKTEPS